MQDILPGRLQYSYKMQGSSKIKLVVFIVLVVCSGSSHTYNSKYGQEAKDPHVNPGLSTSANSYVSRVLEKVLRSGLANSPFQNASKALSFIEGYGGIANILRNLLETNNKTISDLVPLEELVVWQEQASNLLSKKCTNSMDGLFQLLLSGKYQKIEQRKIQAQFS